MRTSEIAIVSKLGMRAKSLVALKGWRRRKMDESVKAKMENHFGSPQ